MLVYSQGIKAHYREGAWRVYIHEAIRSTSEKRPFITRKEWIPYDMDRSTLRILPTDTPDCCIVISDYSSRGPSRGWQPRAEDLAADDWIVCGGSLIPKASRE